MEEKIKFIYISKLDAAKRQLELAIKLFLNNADIVGIHTLTAASHEILRCLAKQQGQESFIKDEMLKAIKSQYVGEWKETINKAQNFFKHADKDFDKTLNFAPEQTEFFLWDACSMYQKITNEHTPLIIIYRMWFFSKNPHLLDDENIKNAVNNAVKQLNLNPNNRGQFLEKLPIVCQIK